MNTPAYIIHQTPGRIRLAIAPMRGDRAYFAALAERLRDNSGILHARGNAAAASLVVEYAGELDELMSALQRSGLALAPAPGAGEQQAGMRLPQALRQMVPNQGAWPMPPMLMAGAVFSVVGVVQTLRGEVMLPALSAFWYAASALRLAHTPLPGHAPAGGSPGTSASTVQPAVDDANEVLP